MDFHAPDINALLQDCLQGLRQGYSLDECLARHPQAAAELRPLLEAALLVQRARPLARDPAAVARGRAQLQQAVRAARAKQTAPVRRSRSGWVGATRWAAVVAVLYLALGATTARASAALPGDPLYAWKRSSEGLRLALAVSPPERIGVRLWIISRRWTR